MGHQNVDSLGNKIPFIEQRLTPRQVESPAVKPRSPAETQWERDHINTAPEHRHHYSGKKLNMWLSSCTITSIKKEYSFNAFFMLLLFQVLNTIKKEKRDKKNSFSQGDRSRYMLRLNCFFFPACITT